MGKYEKAIPELQRAINQATDEASNDMLYARIILPCVMRTSAISSNAVEQWERIYAKKPSFHDISVKLSQYQELRIDDRIKDYLTVKKRGFRENMQASCRCHESPDQGGCRILKTAVR